MCLFFTFVYFFNNSKQEIFALCFLKGELDALALLYFAKIWGQRIRRIGVCGYGYIHGYPRKICGYGYGYEYGWEIDLFNGTFGG